MKRIFLYFLSWMLRFILTLWFINLHHSVYAQITKTSLNETFNCKALLSATNTSAPISYSYQLKNQASTLLSIKNLEKKHSFGSNVDSIKRYKTTHLLKNEDKNKLLQNEKTPLSSNSKTNEFGFEGNIFNGGAPPDNSIAISQSGYIVSVINCNVGYYNSYGDQLWFGSFWELFKDPTLTELIYDPMVQFDPVEKKFVMIAVHGFTSATSKVIVAFSKSDNPLEGWWIYTLSGNPVNDRSWLDYPKFGISNKEIFITGNLFVDNSGFNQSVIYQISKEDGFFGRNLKWKLWSEIEDNPLILYPVSHGQSKNYGPGIFLLNQSPASGNSINLFEITNELDNNPVLLRKEIFKQDYEPSAYASQAETPIQLVTGDCRIQNAYFLNDVIHYVFQSDFNQTNFTGINYNQLNVKTLENKSFLFGQNGFHLSYPSITSFAKTEIDPTSIICFLRSGNSIFPETCYITIDSLQRWSNIQVVKKGNNFVNAFEQDELVRWGDYTGICSRENPTNPEVWLSGCFGTKQRLFNQEYNCFGTWIHGIGTSSISSVHSSELKNSELAVFPNPVIDLLHIQFYNPNIGFITIDVIDMTGNVVVKLFSGTLKFGKNLLTFNKNYLPSGMYIVSVKNETNILESVKFVVK